MKGYRRINISDERSSSENSFFKDNPKTIFLILIIIIIIITILVFVYITSEGQSESNVDIIVRGEENSKLDLNSNYGKSKVLQDILNYRKNIRTITKTEMAEFRSMNNLNILYEQDKYTVSDTPDVSIITTIHNQAHCIYKAIRSVQNQSLKNWEMIIIDDCSLDNSTLTVEQFMKEDSRISLIKNELNEGIMITRNKGIRKARGKYICILDADDTLAQKDILKYSFDIATIGNIDVVEFYTAYYSHNKFKGYYHYHGGITGIISQPELKKKFYEFKDSDTFRPIKCRTVWGKIVKNEVFQKTLDFIPKKYSEDFILGFEDTMITVALYNVAQSYYLFNQPGYYYTFDERRGAFPISKDKKCLQREGIIKGYDHLKFMQYLIDIYEDNEFYKQVLFHELKAINNYAYSNFKKTIKDHFNWAYSIFDELLDSKYLKDEQKKLVQKIKDEVRENELNKQNSNI